MEIQWVVIFEEESFIQLHHIERKILKLVLNN